MTDSPVVVPSPGDVVTRTRDGGDPPAVEVLDEGINRGSHPIQTVHLAGEVVAGARS